MTWIELSMHHLSHDQKERFIARCSQILWPEGTLMAYEPVLRDREEKGQHTQRWWEMCRNQWSALMPEEKATTYNHVAPSDFLESFVALME